MKNPTLTFRTNDKITPEAVDHWLHTEYKDFIYDYRVQLMNIGGIPVWECVVELNQIELNEEEQGFGQKIREEIEKLLGTIETFYEERN